MNAEVWNGAVSRDGLYLGVPEQVYHADPCPAPSLNASVAKLALHRSLLHAKTAHPRLTTPEPEDEPPTITRAMDIGSAAHALSFGVGADIHVVDGADWRKKAAQIERDDARIKGCIPLLPKELKRAEAMASISRPVVRDLLGGSVIAEVMLVWRERGLWRRGLIDRMSADARVIIDYKTTQQIASPVEAVNVVYDRDHHFQEAFYRRGLDTLDPAGRGRRRFCFLYQEQSPPYTLTVIEVDEAGRSLAEEQVQAACNIWDRALITGEWPGYPIGPHIASPKPWVLERWARRAEIDETLNPPEAA